MVVRNDLNFDVPWVENILFKVHTPVSERRLSLRSGLLQSGAQDLWALSNTHALTPSTGGRFDQDGVPDRIRDLDGLLFVLQQSVTTGNDGDLGLDRQ